MSPAWLIVVAQIILLGYVIGRTIHQKEKS